VRRAPPGKPRFLALAVGLGLAAVLAALLVWPLIESLRGAFVDAGGRPTFAFVSLVFENPVYLRGFLNSLAVAAASTVIAGAAGLAVAVVLERFSFAGRRVLSALVPLPLIVPPFVGAIGIKQLLGPFGALNALLVHLGLERAGQSIDWLRNGRFWAVVLLTALHLYPVVYFNASAALANVNPEMEEAAQNLGAGGVRRFTRVTLPLIFPSIFAALTIVFIWGLTELGVPLMCDYMQVTSVQIFSGLKDIGRNPFVYALVAVVLAATASLYALARVSFGRTRQALATKGGARRVPKALRGWRGFACAGAVTLVVLTAALPNLSVVLASVSDDWYRTVLPSSYTLRHFDAALGNAMVVPSIANSLRYVTLSTALDLVLGVAAALIVVRSHSRFSHLLDAAVMVPLAVPGLVMAFGYLAVSREGRPLSFLNPARDPTALLVAAYAIRRLPFVVRAVAAGLQQISGALEEAAQNLGAGPARTFLRVTLPLLGPHLLAGGIFAFALSMLEVSDSLILAQKQTTFPVTKSIYELFQLLGDGRGVAAALGVWAMLFLGVALTAARSALGGRLGGMFRV
jgi:iron(III) transport system permease protein